MIRLLALGIGYFIGCAQSAYIVGKMHKIDIREHGSGNAGSTNVLRTLGAKAGATVFLLDILKAVLSFFLTAYICSKITNSHDFYRTYGLYGGLGTILGHNFPANLNFKGGKGIACSMGLLCAFDIRFGLLVCLIGILVVVVSKYVSLGSISAAIASPIILLFFGVKIEMVIIILVFTFLALYQHRANIKRLINGSESKFSIKRSGT